MKKTSRRVLSLIFAAVLCISLCACKKTPEVRDLGTIHEPEFGGIYIKMTIEEFNSQGFEYGDSVTVTFSNGYKLENLPYYSGYYSDNGSPLLIAYPGYDYIKAAVNNGDDLWEVAGLSEGDTASVKLYKRGSYLNIQEARNIHYKYIREEYPSDEVFANFRCSETGNLKKGTLYRSASPCDNQHNRAPYTDALMKNAGVKTILNLADTNEKIEGYISREDFSSPYFLSLYENGDVVLLGLNMNYRSQDFREKLAAGLSELARREGPYLVHCTEGKDRTGFVCMLLEALCGSSYEEIKADYMLTYDNYYGINEQNEREKYDVIVEKNLNDMIKAVCGDEDVDVTTADLKPYAEKFLKDAGMTDADISAIRSRIEG